MNHLIQYLIDVEARIDDAETSSECIDIANELYDIRLYNKKIIIPQEYPCADYYYALVGEIDHTDAMLADYIKQAETQAEYLKDIEDDEETYGSYDEQTRRTYQGSIL